MATINVNRVNKGNRPAILAYIAKRFDSIVASAQTKVNECGQVSIIDIWNVQFEIQKKFNISDGQSQKLTSELITRKGE